MLKRLNTIKDAVALTKATQGDLNGGLKPSSNNCATVCPGAANGTFCLVNGNPHCPASCDGNGGWNNW